MPVYFRGSNILTPDYWAEGSGGFSVGGAYVSGTYYPSVPTTLILMEIAG